MSDFPLKRRIIPNECTDCGVTSSIKCCCSFSKRDNKNVYKDLGPVLMCPKNEQFAESGQYKVSFWEQNGGVFKPSAIASAFVDHATFEAYIRIGGLCQMNFQFHCSKADLKSAFIQIPRLHLKKGVLVHEGSRF